MAHKRNDIPVTISFSESSKGWTSFKSFLQENGVSLNNRYYTFKSGHLWEHNENETRGSYYGGTIQTASGLWSNTDSAFSHVEVLFNDAPGSVKSFGTLNYEGSQAKNTPDITNDAEYYNNFLKMGWYVEEVMTNLQSGVSLEFRNKEDKWFSKIKGETTEWLDDGKAGNVDTREFSVQGIGNASEILCPECPTVFTSWDCNPGTAGTTGTMAGDPLGSCDGKTILTMPAGSTWDDFGEFTTDPVNGHTATTPDQLGVCLTPYTGWGRTGPFLAATGSGITNHFDWVTQWCDAPVGLGMGNTECCGCGANGDGAYIYSYRYMLIECRTEKALGPPDPGTNPCSYSYTPQLTSNPITGATYAWNQNNHLTTSVANYTSWEGFLTKLLTLQPSLGTTYGVDLAFTNLAALIVALDQFYSDINASDPIHEYRYELPNIETLPCDCAGAGPGTPGVAPVTGTPCECVERQDLLGQYMTELDCLSNCCPQPVTSWNCVPTPSTPSTIFSCDGQLPYYGTEVNVGSMFADMFEYNQYVSDPTNGLTNTAYGEIYACIDVNGIGVTYPGVPLGGVGGPAVPVTQSYPIPVTACECNNGLGVLVNARGPGMPQGDMTPWPTANIRSTYTNYNAWITEINSWGMTPPIPLDTPYDQVQLLIDGYLDGAYSGLYAGFGYVAVPPLPVFGDGFCLCGEDPGGGGGCDCVEVLDASGTYPTEPNCLASCCGIIVPSWDCDNGSCIDPGTGLGLYGTLSACNAVCSSTVTPSWDCVSGNCIDPGTGAGLHSTFSACGAVCGGTSTAIIPCDWESGGHTTGLRHKVRPSGYLMVSVRPGATNGSDIVPFAVTSGTYVHDPAVFFSTHPGGNTWNVGSFPGFPGWDVDDSFMVRATGGAGDMIKMPSGRCWEMRNYNLFPPQQSWNPSGQYSQKQGGVAPYFYAGSYYGPHQVPYWHSYLGKNPEEPGNEDWWRECDCGQPVNFWL